MLVLTIMIFAGSAPGQAPGLLWTTNVGGTLFAVDAQANAYAYAGGKVIQLSSTGQALQTNTICPLPGIARRDHDGNFYFAGQFDGTQNFGGITLVGGWTNWPNPGRWTPGYPTCFLAKYSAGGNLLWAISFGQQAYANSLTDLALDAAGSCYAAYLKSGQGHITSFDDSGGHLATGSLDQFAGSSFSVKVGGTTSSNCAYFLLRSEGYTIAGRVNRTGGFSSGGAYPLRWRSHQCANAKPVIDDLAQIFQVGRCFDPLLDPECSAQVLRKLGADATDVWSIPVTPEAHWTLGRDAQSNVYLAGTNGMFAKYDVAGSFIWSNNFSRQIISMVADASGNRFVSFADGGVARIANEPTPQPLVISTGPQPQTVFVGDPVSLSVSATGTLPLMYEWRRNGTAVSGATASIYSLASAATSHAGAYTVVISNVAGSVTSAPAQLRVKSVQLYFGSQLLTNGTYVFATNPNLSVRSAFPGGSAFYTLDGSAPSFASTIYSAPITLNRSAVVRALGYSSDFGQSEEADAVNIIVLTQHKLLVSASSGGIVTTNLDFPGTETSCTPRPANAVAWWRAENNTQDAAGSHVGTAYQGAHYTNGIVGSAFRFTGDGPHVRIPDAPDLRFTSAMTIEAWVNPSVWYSMPVISKWDGPQERNQNSYRMSLLPGGIATFQASTDGTGTDGSPGPPPPACYSTTPAPVGGWTHLAGTYDGSTLRLYVNGVLEGQVALLGIFSGTDDIGIGATVGGMSAGEQLSSFWGLIDEPALYGRALSAQEILAVYQAGSAGKCTRVNEPYSGGVFIPSEVVNLRAYPDPGCVFLYWLGDAAGTEPTLGISMNRDMAVHAVFGTAFSTTAVGGGQVQVQPPGGFHPLGTTVRLTAIPNPGNYFGFWGNAATGNTNPLYFTIATPTQTVSSIFGATPAGQAALTVLINGNGRVNASPRSNAYPLGQLVTLTAVPDAGQNFISWSGDASGTQNPHSISMNSAKVITANFSSNVRLRVDRPGEGWSPAGLRLTLVGDPVSVSQIFASSNLTQWTSLGSVTNYSGEVQFLDTNAAALPKRFYKAEP